MRELASRDVLPGLANDTERTPAAMAHSGCRGLQWGSRANVYISEPRHARQATFLEGRDGSARTPKNNATAAVPRNEPAVVDHAVGFVAAADARFAIAAWGRGAPSDAIRPHLFFRLFCRVASQVTTE